MLEQKVVYDPIRIARCRVRGLIFSAIATFIEYNIINFQCTKEQIYRIVVINCNY